MKLSADRTNGRFPCFDAVAFEMGHMDPEARGAKCRVRTGGSEAPSGEIAPPRFRKHRSTRTFPLSFRPAGSSVDNPPAKKFPEAGENTRVSRIPFLPTRGIEAGVAYKKPFIIIRL
jgi:hypothetical protein